MLNESKTIKEVTLHPVFLKFLKTYSIFVNHADNIRMLIIETISLVREELERKEEEYMEHLFAHNMS